MPTYKFSARNLPPVPASGQIDFWDESLPGFGMRVSAGGTRTWIAMYRYNGVKRRMKLGAYRGSQDSSPDSSEEAVRVLGLADARDEARVVFRKAEKGHDPATEKQARQVRADTVEDLAKLYIEQYAKKRKRSWFKDDKILKREVVPLIGRKRIGDVTRRDIRDVLKPIVDRNAPIRANHTLEVVRKMFNWSLETRDEPATNPAARLSKPGGPANSRARFLKADELRPFWASLDPEKLGIHGAAAFKLFTLTGQREMEILRMRWEDIDFDDLIWTIPADHAKNQLEHVLPIAPVAELLLCDLRKSAAKADTYVFQSPSRAGMHLGRGFIEKRMVKIRTATGIKDFTPHDLRRTVTTYFGKINVPQLIKKKILNHAKRRKSDVTDVYDRFEYHDQKRDALTKWEELLLSMVAKPTEGNVVPIARASA